MWPAPGKISSRLPGHRLVRGLAVLGRDDRVLLAPDDQRGQDGREVQAVVGAHALAAGVDHRAHRVQEGLAGAAGLQRGEPGARARARSPLGAIRPRRSARAQSGPRTPREVSTGSTQSAPGQRGGAQQQVDLAAEPAAGDEHEPLTALRELVGELHRDAAAERVPDDRHAVVAERGQQVADAAGVGAQRVVPARRGRVPVPEQVGRDDREAVRERGRRRLPRLRRVRDAVQQQEHRAAAGRPVGHRMAVQCQLVAFERDALQGTTVTRPARAAAARPT